MYDIKVIWEEKKNELVNYINALDVFRKKKNIGGHYSKLCTQLFFLPKLQEGLRIFEK